MQADYGTHQLERKKGNPIEKNFTDPHRASATNGMKDQQSGTRYGLASYPNRKS